MQRSFLSRGSGRTRYTVPPLGNRWGCLLGQIMLVFTIVTIIFVSSSRWTLPRSCANETQLPMSFIASFLAIGIHEFPKDEGSDETDWPLSTVASYLCECVEYPIPLYNDQSVVFSRNLHWRFCPHLGGRHLVVSPHRIQKEEEAEPATAPTQSAIARTRLRTGRGFGSRKRP